MGDRKCTTAVSPRHCRPEAVSLAPKLLRGPWPTGSPGFAHIRQGVRAVMGQVRQVGWRKTLPKAVQQQERAGKERQQHGIWSAERHKRWRPGVQMVAVLVQARRATVKMSKAMEREG